MEKNLILQVLQEQREDVVNNVLVGSCERKEENLFEWNSNMAQVVTGVRRSGKSTLCHNALKKRGVVYGYANLDDDRLVDMQTSDLNSLLECIYLLYGTDIQYIFLDEIQNIDGWYLFVNRLLRMNMHVFVTGSNAKLLSGELATHLTGRYIEIKLYPFSFSDYCKLFNIDTTSITTKAIASRKRALLQYIEEGGMPEMKNIQSARNKKTYLSGLIETIVTKDIAKRFKIRNVEALRRITNHLINNCCQTIQYDQLAELSLLGSSTTVQSYVSYLQQAYLIRRLSKFSYKSVERITKEKSYVVDTGFIANRENSLLPENLGWRLENVVFIELLRRNQLGVDDIYYYKPSTRSKEVDFVVCEQGVVKELVQVSYSITEKKAYKREIEALIEAANALHCNNLTLVCFNESQDVKIENFTIKIRSVVEWLLE